MPNTRTQLERIGDRVTVPQPAFDRFLRRRDRRERNRRIAAGVVGMVVFAAGVIAFSIVTGADSSHRPANETPSPAVGVPTFGPRVFAQPDLKAVVLREDDAPSCTDASSGYNEFHGVNALLHLEAPGDGEGYTWGEQFFRGGVTRAFFSRFPKHAPCPHLQAWVQSSALVFANEEAAAREMSLYISNVVETWDWVDLRRSDPGLSQDGVLLEGNATAFGYGPENGAPWAEGTPGTFYMWRINNLVLHINAQGHYDADEMRSLAELMTARARTCSTIETGQAC
jgi:hypothetical protein